MAQRFVLPLQQVFTNLGGIAPGYKLKTYATGTTTPLATYSDQGLTIANANPAMGAVTGNQIADANGRFGNIWMGNPQNYKVILTDPNDVPIYTADPINGGASDSIIIFNPIPTAFWGITAGTSSAYTLASTINISTVGYAAGQSFLVYFNTACSAAPTLAIDGLISLNLKKKNLQGSKVALVAGDVNGLHFCENDGVDIIVLDPLYPFLNGNNITQSIPKVTISNDVSNPNNYIDFTAGNFQFSDGTGFALLSALAKRLDLNWVAGTNQGGLFSGSETSSTWYHCFAIYNPTTGVSDAGFDTSISAANAPSGFTKIKRVGSIYNNISSNIVGFIQAGNDFIWNAMVTDRALASLTGGAGILLTLTTPLGINVIAKTGVLVSAGSVASNRYSLLCDPNASSTMASVSNHNSTLIGTGAALSSGVQSYVEAKTNLSSQVNISVDSTMNMEVITYGWRDYQL